MMNRIAPTPKNGPQPSTFVAGLGVELFIRNSVGPSDRRVNKIVTVTRRGHSSDLPPALKPKSSPSLPERRRFGNPSVLWCPSGYVPELTGPSARVAV